MTFTRTIRVSGTLTDADTTPTIGIVRIDTGVTVVTAGTAMTRDSLGRYSYELVSPVDGVTYRASYAIIVNGQPIAAASEKTAGVDTDVTAEEMVALIKAGLRAAPVGVVTVIVDGQTVTYSRSQALDELKFWQAEAAKESNARPRVSRIRLDRF